MPFPAILMAARTAIAPLARSATKAVANGSRTLATKGDAALQQGSKMFMRGARGMNARVRDAAKNRDPKKLTEGLGKYMERADKGFNVASLLGDTWNGIKGIFGGNKKEATPPPASETTNQNEEAAAAEA